MLRSNGCSNGGFTGHRCASGCDRRQKNSLKGNVLNRFMHMRKSREGTGGDGGANIESLEKRRIAPSISISL